MDNTPKHTGTKHKLTTLFISALVALWSTSCSSNTAITKEANMPLTLYPKTLCFGRYQFSVPKETKITGFADTFNNIQITSEKIRRPNTFESIIKKRVTELQRRAALTDKQIFEEGGYRPIVVDHGNGPTPDSYYISYFEGDHSQRLVMIESYKYTQGYLYKLKEDYVAGFEDKGLKLHFAVLKKLSYRSNTSMPTQPGICINNGFLADPIENIMYSSHRIGVQLIENPEVAMWAGTHLIQKANDKNLIQRVKTAPGYKANKATLLLHPNLSMVEHRLNERTVNGMYGEEYGITLSEQGVQREEQFTWEKPGTVEDSYDPEVTLYLVSNHKGTTKLPVKTIVRLYDRVVESIQPHSAKPLEPLNHSQQE